MNYGDVCEAKTRREMRRRFGILLSQVREKFGKVDEALQRSNVGYVAGYYDNATRIRVQEWLGAEHPIFGRVGKRRSSDRASEVKGKPYEH